jgi:hypothetical protein
MTSAYAQTRPNSAFTAKKLSDRKVSGHEPGNRSQRSVSAPLSGLVDLCGCLPRPALEPGPPFHHLACQAVCWSRCAPRCIPFHWEPCACNRRTSNAEPLLRSSYLGLITCGGACALPSDLSHFLILHCRAAPLRDRPPPLANVGSALGA